jgi:hypothetical protein
VEVDAIAEHLHKAAVGGLVFPEFMMRYAAKILGNLDRDLELSEPGPGYTQEQHNGRLQNMQYTKMEVATYLSESVQLRLAGLNDFFLSRYQLIHTLFPELPPNPRWRTVEVRQLDHPPQVLREGSVDAMMIDWTDTLFDMVINREISNGFAMAFRDQVVMRLEAVLYQAPEGKYSRTMRTIQDEQRVMGLVNLC